MKKALSILALFLMFGNAFAQQETQMSQYMFHNASFNPGAFGSSEGIAVNGWLREQWMGFKDDNGEKVAPETYLISADSPLKFLHGGIGICLLQDKLGFEKSTGLKLGYAYKAELGMGTLSAGLNVGLQNRTIDFAKFKLIDEGDGLISSSLGEKTDMMIDLGLGVYYSASDRYYIGFSATNLLQTKGNNTYYQNHRHFYLTGGYKWILPSYPAFQLEPSALIKTDGAVFQADLDAVVLYNNKIWGGLGYRYQDAVKVLAGMYIKDLRIGLAYDIGASSQKRYNNGSMEVSIGYMFKLETDKLRKSYRNTRFL